MVSSAPHFKLVLLISYPHYLLDRLLAVGETRIKFLLLRTEERYNSFRDWTNDPMTNSRKISFQGNFFFYWFHEILVISLSKMGKWKNFVKLIWNKETLQQKQNYKKMCVKRLFWHSNTWQTRFWWNLRNLFSRKKAKVTDFFNFLFLQVLKKEIICQIDFKREQGLWAVEPKTPRL